MVYGGKDYLFIYLFADKISFELRLVASCKLLTYCELWPNQPRPEKINSVLPNAG